jgi:1-acyl-sn-glycerol-3-phosphate acyltransferase
LARLLRLRLEVRGRNDTAPLVVCNHISYLDVIALGSISPLRFVAMAEVRQWLWVGWLARCAGTIFLCSGNRGSLLSAMQRVRMAVQQRQRVAMFLEGSSADGSRVLPFHSALLAVAVEESWPVLPAWIGYELPNGDRADESGWWGQMSLLSYLWRLLGCEEIVATMRFGRVVRHWDRKVLADELHHSVCDLAELPHSSRQPAPVFQKPAFLYEEPTGNKMNLI